MDAFEGLVLCSSGEHERGEALLRDGRLADAPLAALVRHALLASTPHWSTPAAVKKDALRVSNALRWSAEQLVAGELFTEWAALLTTCAALLGEADTVIKRNALLTTAHVLSQHDAGRRVAAWHSGPTLVRLAWAQMIFEDLCEFAAPLVVRLVSIVHASDLEQHYALMEHLISLGRRVSAPPLYKAYCRAQVLALLRSAPPVYLAVLPSVVEFSLDALHAGDDAVDSALQLLEACAECDGATKFCSIAIATGLRLAANRWSLHRERCAKIVERWLPEQMQVYGQHCADGAK